MIIAHRGKAPRIDPTAYVAPNAVVCGDVSIGPHACILFGAAVIAEGGTLEIGSHCVVMQNAVVRASARFATRIGPHCLVGPNAHVVGCELEGCVFVATGAAVFHGARLGEGAEVRINGVVHLRSRLAAGATVPIGWVAVGDPAEILPPHEHDRIWALQEPLDFPGSVYGVERPEPGETAMPEITRRLCALYAEHADDRLDGED